MRDTNKCPLIKSKFRHSYFEFSEMDVLKKGFMMSRTARFLKNGSCYYIQSQGFRSQKVFKMEIDYQRYVRLLKKYKLQFQIKIYGYCLMSAETHLIVHPGDAGKLSSFMQGINQSYALYFNGRYERAGKVWGQRYKSILINSDYDLFDCIKSVEFIPVKARQSHSPVEYAWSSCAHRVLGSNGVVDSMPPAGPVLEESI